MTVSRSRLAIIVADMFAEHGKAKTAEALAYFLREAKLSINIDLLMKDVSREINQRHKVLNTTVYSARELTADLHAQLKGYLQQLTQAEQVHIDNQLDPTLIGGVVIATPDQHIDWSLRGKLNLLKQSSSDRLRSSSGS